MSMLNTCFSISDVTQLKELTNLYNVCLENKFLLQEKIEVLIKNKQYASLVSAQKTLIELNIELLTLDKTRTDFLTLKRTGQEQEIDLLFGDRQHLLNSLQELMSEDMDKFLLLLKDRQKKIFKYFMSAHIDTEIVNNTNSSEYQRKNVRIVFYRREVVLFIEESRFVLVSELSENQTKLNQIIKYKQWNNN